MPRRPLLSCRQFRRLHAEFMDAMLSHDDATSCRVHLESCVACAAHDVMIRRSLMALQALRTIEPSPDFRSKLAERIARDQIAQTAVPHGVRRASARWGVAGALFAASVAMFAFVATPSQAPAPVRLSAVMARAPQPVAVADAKPAPKPSSTAVAANRSSARFESLPGQLPLRVPSEMRPSSMRIQTVNYIGQ